jgi:predicted nucleic acid-binding protein
VIVMPDEVPGGLIVAEPRASYATRLPLVADCSALASLLFDEPERAESLQAMTGRDLFAPDLIDHELVSVAVRKSRLGLELVAAQGLADLTRLQLTRCQVDPQAQWRLALQYDLSAYDAAYLWLAAELRAPLVTFDHRLGAAARLHLGGAGSG